MIHFFRKIRRSLLSQNKISKYLIYGIGEILLVVVGILIALAANNYSEKQKAIAQSRVFLNDMLEDLASDTTYLDKMLPTLSNKLLIEEWLLNKETFNNSDVDSIKLAVQPVNWTFNVNDRSFLNIQSTASTKLIGFEVLYPEISKYYINTKERIALNNQIERQQSINKSDFEQVIQANLLINTKQYTDYSGFQVGLDRNSSSSDEDPAAVISSLSKIQTNNDLYDKYARHNFIYLALFLCDIEAKKLIKNINRALKTDS